MNVIAIFFLLLQLINPVVFGFSGYTAWSPDGEKTLWCPDSSDCLKESSAVLIDHCCACTAVPNWEIPNSISTHFLRLEMLDLRGTKSKLFSNLTLLNGTQFYFSHLNGVLREFPINVCDNVIVHIDLSGNLFRHIGNISCHTELDTLIMKNNKITFVSNQTFVGMKKLRKVDLSHNLITNMDLNIFHDIHVLSFNLEGNQFHSLDVSNIFMMNKTICGSSYAKNKNSLKITNIGNLLLGQDNSFMCGDNDFSYVDLDAHPVLTMGRIDPITLNRHAPCGQSKYYGTAFHCDCNLAEFISLDLKDLYRLYSKQVNETYCLSPQPLANLSLETVYGNQTLRNLMTCDVIDACPKHGKCKCQCTSQPNKNLLIVDCSNQECTDFPEKVPLYRHEVLTLEGEGKTPLLSKYDIILNMSNNYVTNVNIRQDYFSKVTVLDLSDNHITTLNENITNLKRVSEFIIIDHKLNALPRSIAHFNPDIFHFGTNGIPCGCENAWIGEWRSYKQASREYPYSLFCSNYHRKLFEDVLKEFIDCNEQSEQSIRPWMLAVIIILSVVLSLLWLAYCFRYDLYILKRKASNAYKQSPNRWEIDVYISFDQENEDSLRYVIWKLDKFLRRKKITTYIPCRDALPGTNEEQNVKDNITKCKYVLIIQSKDMYHDDTRHSCTRRMEYTLAWEYFIKRKIEKIFVLYFDADKPDKFHAPQTKALFRWGMGFAIHNRKHYLNYRILEIISDPLLVYSKHKVQRNLQIKAGLWDTKGPKQLRCVHK